MRVSFDPAKRERTLADRGLDFKDAVEVVEGLTWRGSPRYQHEKSQCPRKSARLVAPWALT